MFSRVDNASLVALGAGVTASYLLTHLLGTTMSEYAPVPDSDLRLTHWGLPLLLR